MLPQPLVGVEQARLIEPLDGHLKHGFEVAQREWIEQRAALRVTGHLLDAQQPLGFIASLGVLQAA